MVGSFQDRAQVELKRGVLQLAVLASLRRATYGYDLLKVLEQAGIPTEEGTLYPILRRLDKDGLLAAEWNTSGTRPRKYYSTTDKGRDVLDALVAEWTDVTRALERVLAPREEMPQASAGESDVERDGQPGSA